MIFFTTFYVVKQKTHQHRKTPCYKPQSTYRYGRLRQFKWWRWGALDINPFALKRKCKDSLLIWRRIEIRDWSMLQILANNWIEDGHKRQRSRQPANARWPTWHQGQWQHTAIIFTSDLARITPLTVPQRKDTPCESYRAKWRDVRLVPTKICAILK